MPKLDQKALSRDTIVAFLGDIFERRGGVWKIIRRRGMTDWNSPVTPAPTLYSSLPEGSHALRNKDDDYYKMLAIFEAGG